MYSQQQQRYLAEAVETASPAARLVMLYDRLLLDLSRAETACSTGNVVDAHANLVHAQQIVGVLADTLDRSVWNGAQNLYDLYEFLYRELIDANLTKNAAKVANCTEVVRPLAAAWHEAAAILASQSRVEQHSGVA
jgi:flagellar protein FliS